MKVILEAEKRFEYDVDSDRDPASPDETPAPPVWEDDLPSPVLHEIETASKASRASSATFRVHRTDFAKIDEALGARRRHCAVCKYFVFSVISFPVSCQTAFLYSVSHVRLF